ncbi:PREDICTED: acyl-lipid (8-3)-desaturase B-like isoform X1 [Amphimedon queenslandica]|uniref:Cytochrome b5 heme-binding domain-containing protein n=1 Tax=Amphimedon queenslandica TaxID=400682 RepID=A0A1X7URC6_AMPQE|nr:PREDICTED: acyl-lipid (8-3)-desaturase B-like isoform X1 [Amphimedon queenslandica]|eukprot:XP_019852860.1 PREDICTED: acyl-lipid (8-3)-desaturase B-like isoform X1 [Amphimedon queenslandica]
MPTGSSETNADQTSQDKLHKKFTWKELSALNKPENVHVAYKGKVYDVSSFVSSHPGGVDQIMMGAGRDITHLFDVYHQPQTIKFLEKYYVGELTDVEFVTYPEEKNQFYSTLKKRVKEKFKSLQIDTKFDYKMFLLYFTYCSFCALTWYSMLISGDSYWLRGIFSSAALGIFTGLSFYSMFHDASHCCITHSPMVWRIARIIVQCVTGLSMYCWMYRHTCGHHIYTNVDIADPDCRTQVMKKEVWRLKHKQSWFKRYEYQHLYMPLFIYTFYSVIMNVQDFVVMKNLEIGRIRLNPPSTYQRREFYFMKIFHHTMRLIVPLFYMSLTSMLLYNLIYQVVLGHWILLLAQLSHLTTKVSLSEDIALQNKSWAEYQVLTTKDYDTDSLLCTLLTGTLNHQVAHHLFPDVLQSYYPIITPIVRDTCKEFGIQYNCEASLFVAIKEHLTFLFKMGQEPAETKTH